MSPVVWKGTEKSTINHELAQYRSAGGENRREGGGGRKGKGRGAKKTKYSVTNISKKKRITFPVSKERPLQKK